MQSGVVCAAASDQSRRCNNVRVKATRFRVSGSGSGAPPRAKNVSSSTVMRALVYALKKSVRPEVKGAKRGVDKADETSLNSRPPLVAAPPGKGADASLYSSRQTRSSVAAESGLSDTSVLGVGTDRASSTARPPVLSDAAAASLVPGPSVPRSNARRIRKPIPW